ncbi:hypothetical protein OAE89_01035 [Crocinitomicaceae bacterium]|jgi:hypothetical protein|nr:hypothetical protein [Crocinitomicaceae bacterium]
MTYQEIVQLIHKDEHFKEEMKDRFGKQAESHIQTALINEETEDPLIEAINEILESGGEQELSGGGIYSDPYAMCKYGNHEIYWVTCDYNIIQGYFNNVTEAENAYYELLEEDEDEE